jgi:hypothetical protein
MNPGVVLVIETFGFRICLAFLISNFEFPDKQKTINSKADWFRFVRVRSGCMIRARLWFRCAAMHDPVTPVMVKQAVIGWDAKERQVDLTIERPFRGDELVSRMKGWVTVDVKEVIGVVKAHGYLKVLDERNLVVETETEEDYHQLERAFQDHFQDQLDLERF